MIPEVPHCSSFPGYALRDHYVWGISLLNKMAVMLSSGLKGNKRVAEKPAQKPDIVK